MNFENNNGKHFSLIIGPYQAGKDTFIYNISKNYFKEIPFIAKTEELKLIEYRNFDFIQKSQCYILNTPGFANPNNIKDDEIVIDILKWIQNQEFISFDCIFLIQPLGEPFIIEKCIKYLKIIFGDEITQSSIIIATKSNNLDEDSLDDRLNLLKEIGIKYGVKGGVFEFRGYYILNKKNEMIESNSSSSNEEVQKQIVDLGKTIKLLPSFRFLKIKDDYDNFFSQKKDQISMKKKRKKTFWDYIKYYFFFGWLINLLSSEDSSQDEQEFLPYPTLKKAIEDEYFNEISIKLKKK